MGKRPDHVKAPAHWEPGPPPPQPAEPQPADARTDERQPTRYGDWELNGIAVDF